VVHKGVLGKCMLVVPVVILTAFIALVAILGLRDTGGHRRERDPLQLNEQAPDLCLKDCEGRRYDLSNLRGHYVMLVFFCGCAPCRELNSALVKVKARHPNAAIIGITAMGQADLSLYRSKQALNYPTLMDAYQKTSREWNSMKCPKCWIIDPSGRIAYGNSSYEPVPAILTALARYRFAG